MKKAFMVVIVIMAMIIFAGCGLGNDKTEAKVEEPKTVVTEIRKEASYKLEYGDECVMRINDTWIECREVIAITEIQPNGDTLTATVKELLTGDQYAIWESVNDGSLFVECFNPEIGRYVERAYL